MKSIWIRYNLQLFKQNKPPWANPSQTSIHHMNSKNSHNLVLKCTQQKQGTFEAFDNYYRWKDTVFRGHYCAIEADKLVLHNVLAHMSINCKVSKNSSPYQRVMEPPGVPSIDKPTGKRLSSTCSKLGHLCNRYQRICCVDSSK